MQVWPVILDLTLWCTDTAVNHSHYSKNPRVQYKYIHFIKVNIQKKERGGQECCPVILLACIHHSYLIQWSLHIYLHIWPQFCSSCKDNGCIERCMMEGCSVFVCHGHVTGHSCLLCTNMDDSEWFCSAHNVPCKLKVIWYCFRYINHHFISNGPGYSMTFFRVVAESWQDIELWFHFISEG